MRSTLVTLLLAVVLTAGLVVGAKDRYKTTFDFEAEQSFVSYPMTVSADANASGGKFVSSATNSAGSVTFQLTVSTPGDYLVWCRVVAATAASDSFFVSLDEEPEDVFDAAEGGTLGANWQWARLNGRGGGDQAAKLNPRLLRLAEGRHELTFRARETGTRLDRVIVTNDLSFVPGRWPSGAQATPTPTPQPSPVPADDDKDGVPNPQDKCPATPSGTQVDPTGCPLPKPTPTPPPGARQFFASPAGTAKGDGSQSNPWDLVTAMKGPGVKAGDTIYLRAGSHPLRGSNPNGEPLTYYATLTGAAGKPVVIRAYPGERASVDVRYSIEVTGSYLRFQDVEFLSTDGRKFADAYNTSLGPGGVNVRGAGVEFVNCVFHDLLNLTAHVAVTNPEACDADWKACLYDERASSKDMVVHGCLFYYNGVVSPTRSEGQSIYAKNYFGMKDISNNVSGQNFAHNFQIFGSKGPVNNFLIERNVLFKAAGVAPGVLMGGKPGNSGGFNLVIDSYGNTVRDNRVRENVFYDDGSSTGTNVTYQGGTHSENNEFVGNITWSSTMNGLPLYFAGWAPFTAWTHNTTISPTNTLLWFRYAIPPAKVWDYNRYYAGADTSQLIQTITVGQHSFEEWRKATGRDANSTFTAGAPSGQIVKVFLNKYEAGRAHITVLNFSKAPTATINLAEAGLKAGQGYEIRDAQNYYGPPIFTGVFDDGKPVTLTLPDEKSPMPQIEGWGKPGNEGLKAAVHTGREFNVFVLLPR